MTRTDRIIASAGGVGFPDWDSSKSSAIDLSVADIDHPYTMTRDGVLSVHVTFDGSHRGGFLLLINGATVWCYSSWDRDDLFEDTCLVLVSAGDKISRMIVNGYKEYSATYYPFKS